MGGGENRIFKHSSADKRDIFSKVAELFEEMKNVPPGVAEHFEITEKYRRGRTRPVTIFRKF